MTPSEKQTRLDCLEIYTKFGFYPNADLIKRARRVSEALFTFDELCAGGDGRRRIEWKSPDGTDAEFREGEPHIICTVTEYDPTRREYCENTRDCGKTRNVDKAARKMIEELNGHFYEKGRGDVRAVFGGDLRYIKIVSANNDYSLID